MRSIYASTRSLLSNTATRDLGDGGSGKQKKVKKNAVMDHAEPQVFQRVVHLNSSSKSKDPSAPRESNCSDAISYVVVSFVKQVVPLFFNSTTKLRRHSKQQQQQQSQQPNQPQTVSRHELKQITWKNFALKQATGGNQLNSEPAAANANSVDLVAWKQGNCLVIYPDGPSISGGENEKATMSESVRLRQQRERKSAVVALFEALESLVQALMISRA